MMRFEFQSMDDWPVLAWLAKCPRRGSTVTVLHGARVETADHCFSEAAWAGDYGEGDLDATDIVAGSGGRLREDGLTFVSSGSTLDRLNVFEDEDHAWVSNSLACLLAAVGATIDASYPHYYRDFYSIVNGIDGYKKDLACSCGKVELVYFNNVRWDGARLAVIPKPGGALELGSFDGYLEFLRNAMVGFSANLASRKRRVPYTMLTTISSGYDSPTVTALARGAGCNEALCFDRSHRGEDDSGEAIARHLGIQPALIRGDAWKSIPYPEVPFLASNSMGEEVRFRAAEDRLAGRVVLTGYHGDKVWDPHTTALGPTLVRGDPSGLALTEYRLWAGFIHCPVPFWGARQISAINRIARSDEMQPWSIGGDYNRPICRRIVEQSGVPRELFGMTKKNASVMLHNYDEFLTASSLADFTSWLKAHRLEWIKRMRLPPIASAALDRTIHKQSESFCASVKRMPVAWRLAGLIEGEPTYLRRYLFPWALEHAKSRYASLSN